MRRLSPFLALLVACPPGDTPDDAPTCAWSEGAHAGLLAEGDWTPEGPDALARPGDALLANGRAAFVIQGPDDPRTYYHYGGIPIDAVPMDGCTQAAPEVFGEVGILPASLNVTDFVRSSMRQFRADTVEVLSDGTDGGPARVRLTGTDDRFWLVDHALTRDAAGSGEVRPLSGPMGVEIVVDYTLPPDSASLRMDLTVRNLTDAPNQVFLGALLFPSDLTSWDVYTRDEIGFGGFRLRLGVPWFAMSSGETAYALAFDSPNMAWTNVSGANALLDADALLSNASTLAPSGTQGDEATATWWIATAPGERNAAVEALHDVRPTLNGEPWSLRSISGRVTGGDEAIVEVLRERPDGTLGLLDRLATDADGRFSGRIPAEGIHRLRARSGRHPASPLLDVPAGDAEGLRLALGPVGSLDVRATDGDGAIPAKLSVYDASDTLLHTLYVPPTGEVFDLPTGTWSVSLTRGYEHAPFHGEVTITEDGTTSLDAELPRVVDTEGWISVDGHVHTAPSPDSSVLPERRFATAAAAGLEVMVQTDHEILVDLSDELAASPWAGFVTTVMGEEVTATNPEHLNMWGVPLGPEDGPRGRPVVWYGRDIAELYAAMRDRGAGLVQMNHPSWMTLVGYDLELGDVRATDPTRYGFEAGDALWSWDFDAIEIQNGFKDVFSRPSEAGNGGLFWSWQSFFNHGHRITGVGVSDVHGMDTPGRARTYVPAADDLDAFVEGPVLQAVLSGRAVSSAGAFATVRVGNDDAGFDASLGDTVTLAGDDVVVRTEVRALPGVRVDRVVVFANCDAVAAVDASDPDGLVKLSQDIPVTLTQDAHLTVVGFGTGSYPRGLDQPSDQTARVITNPVFVDVDGNGTFEAPGGKPCDDAGLLPFPIEP